MEVFLVIKRKKTSIFLDVKEDSLVSDVKKVLQGIVKKSPEDIRLLYKDLVVEDARSMADIGLTSNITKAQQPAMLGLTLRNSDGDFEELDITPVSSPPEAPTPLKAQEAPAAGS